MSAKRPEQVSFCRIPIAFSCPVPVTDDGETMRDGEPIPLDERGAKCGGDAPYLIGSQIVCEEHLRQACLLMELDPDDVLIELFANKGGAP